MPDHPHERTTPGHPVLWLWCRIQSRIATGERGQTTAEYALVVLGAATVAMLLIAWAISSFGHQVGETISPPNRLTDTSDPTSC